MQGVVLVSDMVKAMVDSFEKDFEDISTRKKTATTEFVNQFNGRKIIGTVGQLQFEVIQYRLLHEYGAQCRWEPLSLYKACWIESDDAQELENFKKRKFQFMAADKEGRDVFLADSNYVLQMAQNDFKNIRFHFTSEF